MGFGSGQGVKCYHSEHLYGEFWHRAFTVSPDTPLCNYLISCGANVEASGGVVGVWRHANARERGMKRVQVEPHLSVTGACSAEWVPIKPKTDAAFLYALIHVLLHEVAARPARSGVPEAAHLVALSGRPERLFPARPGNPEAADVGPVARRALSLRHARPPIRRSKAAVSTATPSKSAPTTRCWQRASWTASRRSPSSSRTCSPTRRSGQPAICDVPAATIRRIATNFSHAAQVGETIEIEGRTLPFRPVAVSLGKTVNNGWGGYECCWARTVLATLVGGLEVPGGTLGTTVRLNRPLRTNAWTA